MSSVERANYQDRYHNPNAVLPYGATPEQIASAIQEFYAFMGDINEYLLSNEYSRMESLLRANNALSDFCGDIVTENVANECPTLAKNEKQDGFPDLLPKDVYDDYHQHHATEGIETKCSLQPGGWQAHNAEASWFLIFRYRMGSRADEPYAMAPIEFSQVLAAELVMEDWSFSGRGENSRRTITASILKSGMDKLRSNPIYQMPEAIVGQGHLGAKYRRIQASFDPVYAEATGLADADA